MGLLRAAAHSMFGDRVPSNEERTLRHHARKLRRRARWANRLSKNSAATRMLDQQALQMALAYEIIREQRYTRLATMYAAKKSECSATRYRSRADCSRAVIVQLQQQLVTYQPPQQYVPAQSPQYSAFPVEHQQQQSAGVAALPVTMQSAANRALPPPPAYSGPAFAHYPTVNQWAVNASTPTSSSSSASFSSSRSSIASPYSDRNQLQEPWLSPAEKRTMY